MDGRQSASVVENAVEADAKHGLYNVAVREMGISPAMKQDEEALRRNLGTHPHPDMSVIGRVYPSVLYR